MAEIGRKAVAAIDAPEDAIVTKLMALMPEAPPPPKGKGKKAKVGDSAISAAPKPSIKKEEPSGSPSGSVAKVEDQK